MRKTKRGSRVGDEIGDGLEEAAEAVERDLARRGNVIIAKGGRAMILTPLEALKVIEALIDWETDAQRRPKRIEV